MAGGVITTGSLPKLLWEGLQEIFGVSYKQHDKTYPRLFNLVSSDKKWEEYVGITGFGPGAIKPEGQGLSYDSQAQGAVTRLTNVTYALGYIVTYEEIKDNLYRKITASRTKSLAFSMLTAREINGHAVYNYSTTSGYVGGDGVVLGSTAHPNQSGGTFSNTQSTPADLSEASIEDALIQIRGFTDDKGLPINCRARSLIVPRQEFYNGVRLTRSDYRPGTANNDVNATKITGAFPEGLIDSVFLTAAHTWFIRTDAGGDGHGMIFQEREPVRFFSDNEFDTFNFKAGAMERYTAGWDDPRGIFVAPGP